MSETGQLGLEQTADQAPPARESEGSLPRGHGRDWFLGLLLFLLALCLLAVVGVAVFILLAVFLPSFELQSLVLTFPPTAPHLLQSISGRLTLFQLAVGLLVALLLLAFFLYLIARWRVVRKRYLWPEAGCPACAHETLVRVHRHRNERLYAWIGIPVRRYHCRECRWQGLRIHKGVEHFSVSDKWAETIAGNGNESARATLPFPSSGEDRAAILGTAVYDGSNEKWKARLNDLRQKDQLPPFPIELNSGAESAGGSDDGSPPMNGEEPPHTDASDPKQVGTSPDGQRSYSMHPWFSDQMPDERANNGREVPRRLEGNHTVTIGKIAAPFGLNLRARPQSDAELLGLLAPGTNVLLLDQVTVSDGTTWHHVEIDERHGWVLSAFVEGME